VIYHKKKKIGQFICEKSNTN